MWKFTTRHSNIFGIVNKNQYNRKKKYVAGKHIKLTKIIKSFVKSIILNIMLVYQGFEPLKIEKFFR
jgi:hypothetical protein